jgi:hypothetical protein
LSNFWYKKSRVLLYLNKSTRSPIAPEMLSKESKKIIEDGLLKLYVIENKAPYPENIRLPQLRKPKEEKNRQRLITLGADDGPVDRYNKMVEWYSDFIKETFDQTIDKDNWRLITWNPNFEEAPDTKWKRMYEYLNNAFKCCSYYNFMPELSESGRLHMHGWVVIKDKVKWFKDFIPRLKRYGMIKVDKPNSVKAFEYYKKEAETTVQILDKYRFPLCDQNNYVHDCRMPLDWTMAKDEFTERIKQTKRWRKMGFKVEYDEADLALLANE